MDTQEPEAENRMDTIVQEPEIVPRRMDTMVQEPVPKRNRMVVQEPKFFCGVLSHVLESLHLQ